MSSNIDIAAHPIQLSYFQLIHLRSPGGCRLSMSKRTGSNGPRGTNVPNGSNDSGTAVS